MKETVIKCDKCKSENVSEIDSKVEEISVYKDAGKWYMSYEEFSHYKYVRYITYECKKCGYKFVEKG